MLEEKDVEIVLWAHETAIAMFDIGMGESLNVAIQTSITECP